ncbi:MAG: SOS response-associated peptidase family protein [SAR324 cluster bacterium]|nr:SOS response-associated peptidase family protein [SAR324 cluster bacterium]
MCYSAMVEADLEVLESEFQAKAVRDAFNAYHKFIEIDAKSYPPISKSVRIYPQYYAPIIHPVSNEKIISPMRYSAFPPIYMTNTKQLTTYNARKDSLMKKFWSEARQNPGIVVLKEFYEWVKVKDLLDAKIISLDEVKEQFERQANERKQRWIESGKDIKKFKPSKTELTDPRFRKIIISFFPKSGRNLVVPVIFNHRFDDYPFPGFAIITDEPNEEISRAGHNRMPLHLPPELVEEWLNPHHKFVEKMEILTQSSQSEYFQVALAA